MNDNPYDNDPGIIEVEMWEDFVDRVNRPRLNTPEAHALHNQGKLLLGRSAVGMIHAIVPDAAIEDDHPDHDIFLTWRALRQAIDTRSNRVMEEEMEWAYNLDTNPERTPNE